MTIHDGSKTYDVVTPIRVRVVWRRGKWYALELIAANRSCPIEIGHWAMRGERSYDARNHDARTSEHVLRKGAATAALRALQKAIRNKETHHVVT